MCCIMSIAGSQRPFKVKKKIDNIKSRQGRLSLAAYSFANKHVGWVNATAVSYGSNDKSVYFEDIDDVQNTRFIVSILL